MQIFINGEAAQITLDTEKTLGDVLFGIESWISISGNRIQRVSVDNKDLSGDTLPEAFDREIIDIEKLDLAISSWRELAVEALNDLLEICLVYGKAEFDERKEISSAWENSASARFIAADISDIGELAKNTLSGEGLSPVELALLIEERLREILHPGQEIAAAENLVKIIVQRMEELPLDLQTGKDQRAAETVQLFSRFGEKLFRVYFIEKRAGLFPETFAIDNLDAKSFIDEFNTALKELSDAYESRDTVLAGDIAEYELAPRLLKFFIALNDILNSDVPIETLS